MDSSVAAFSLRHPSQTVRTLRNFCLTVWDPSRSDIDHGVNALVFSATRSPRASESMQQRSVLPQVAKLYDAGYDPPLDLARLEQLADGTLGREYVRFVRTNRITPLLDLLRLGAPRNFTEYFVRRAYKLHDVLHVVLGCDATVLGEVRIVSFSLGQKKADRARAAELALLVLFLNLLIKRPWQLVRAAGLARRWYRMGRGVPHYAGAQLEDWMDVPVEQVRARILLR